MCTRRATSLGTTGFTPNGAVQPRARPGQWWFEYGETAAYGAKTATRNLGPRLSAHYREKWDTSTGGWSGGLGAEEFSWVREGGAESGYVNYAEPSGDDDNHVDGIGTIHLVDYLHVGTYLPEGYMNPRWAGGDPDLRDARVRVAVRNADFVHQTSELVSWVQSDIDLSLQSSEGFQRANWGFTDFWLTDALMSPGWHTVEYALTNNSWAWSYGGQNLSQQRDNYRYWSLDNSLRHANCDVFHVLAFVDPNNLPTGAIDLDEFELTYRNHSVLLASNGGALVATPPGSTDPTALTDGWRHGAGHVWRSAPNPSGPLELTWELANMVRVQTVQVHQDPDFPSKDVEVLVSTNGTDWKSIAAGTVPASAVGGPNYAFFIAGGETTETGIQYLDADARFVKVRILSGYQSSAWGLGEIEVFGPGAVMQTEDAWYHLNTDIEGLVPGKTYHYRMVAEIGGVTTYGNDATFTVPTGRIPEVVTGEAKKRGDGTTTLVGWLNPLGKPAQYYFEWGEQDFDQRSTSIYGGLERTPRAVTTTVQGLVPGRQYRFRVVGVNDGGVAVGDPTVFIAK